MRILLFPFVFSWQKHFVLAVYLLAYMKVEPVATSAIAIL